MRNGGLHVDRRDPRRGRAAYVEVDATAGGARPFPRLLACVLLLLASVLAHAQSTASVQLDASLEDVTREAKWDARAIVERVPRGEFAWWVDGDEVSFAYHGAALAVTACCGIQAPLHPLGGSDAWVLRVRVPDLEEAVLSLDAFVQYESGGAAKHVP